MPGQRRGAGHAASYSGTGRALRQADRARSRRERRTSRHRLPHRRGARHAAGRHLLHAWRLLDLRPDQPRRWPRGERATPSTISITATENRCRPTSPTCIRIFRSTSRSPSGVDDVGVIIPTPEMQRRILAIMDSPDYHEAAHHALFAGLQPARHQVSELHRVHARHHRRRCVGDDGHGADQGQSEGALQADRSEDQRLRALLCADRAQGNQDRRSGRARSSPRPTSRWRCS